MIRIIGRCGTATSRLQVRRSRAHFWSFLLIARPFLGCLPSEYLKVCPRFCSEFGFQSFPSVPTLRQVIADPDEDFNVRTFTSLLSVTPPPNHVSAPHVSTERDPVQVASSAMEFRQRSPAMGNKGTNGSVESSRIAIWSWLSHFTDLWCAP